MRRLRAAAVGAVLVALEACNSDKRDVSLTASVDPRCPMEQPLRVVVTNRSAKTLREVEYRVEVFAPGDSRNLADYSQPTWTRIVKPGGTVDRCMTLRMIDPVPRNAVVRMVDVHPTFFADGDTIPQ